MGVSAALPEGWQIWAHTYQFENEIAIYGKKVAIMSLSAGESIGILIESETLSCTMRAVFNLAWIGASNFIV